MWADPDSSTGHQHPQGYIPLPDSEPDAPGTQGSSHVFDTANHEALLRAAFDPSQLEDIDPERHFWPSDNHDSRHSEDFSAHLIHSDNSRNRHSRRRRSSNDYTQNRSIRMVHHHREEDNTNPVLPRLDLVARNSLREMIFSAVMSEALSPLERVALLDDCRASAEASNLGIPFRDILSEPMEPFGVSPLMYELMGCQPDWDAINDHIEIGNGLEMVLYLVEHWYENVLAHGKMGVRMNVIRTACLRRFDEYEGNRLFQYLRPMAEAHSEDGKRYFEYDISVFPLGGVQSNMAGARQPSKLNFSALINIPHFAGRSSELRPSETIPGLKSPLSIVGSTWVSIEFIAARRAWRLKVDSNILKLELLDGPGGSTPCIPDEESSLIMDAGIKIITPERNPSFSSKPNAVENGTPIDLFLPRTSLRPLDVYGTTETTLSPCFCAGPDEYPIHGLDDARLLHDGRGALLLELTVRFVPDPTAIAYAPLLPQGPAPENEAGPSNSRDDDVFSDEFEAEDDLYVDSELEENMAELSIGARHDESEWEEVSQIDETEFAEGGWVKASWSGKDEEL